MAGHVGVKGVYQKLGKRNTKRSIVGPRGKPEAERACFCSSGALKTYITYAKGRTGGSHPMTNEWGGAWAVPSQVSMV
jgi:hypothetical protein